MFNFLFIIYITKIHIYFLIKKYIINFLFIIQ